MAVARRSLPSSRTRSRTRALPVADCSLDTRPKVARGARDVARSLLEQLGAGRERLPGQSRRARLRDSACSTISVSQLRLDGDGQLLGRLRPPACGVDDAVADPADLVLETPHQLAGADELLPAGEHLASQQGAVLGGVVERGEPVGVHLDRRRCAAAPRSAPGSRAPWRSRGSGARSSARHRRGSCGPRRPGRRCRRPVRRASRGSRRPPARAAARRRRPRTPRR